MKLQLSTLCQIACAGSLNCIATANSALAQSNTDNPMARLAPLAGEWRGEAKHYRPRQSGDSAVATETVDGDCQFILEQTYLECETNWVRDDGRERGHNSYMGADEKAGHYEILFLFRNTMFRLSYPFEWDEATQRFMGFHDDGEVDGKARRVRAEWGFSEDGNRYWAREFNHIDGEPEAYWPMTFEMTWDRR